jgi:hypothetical protein
VGDAAHRLPGAGVRPGLPGDEVLGSRCRCRFVQLTGATKTINRELEAKARALAGLKGYVTNLPDPTPEFVMGAYHSCGRSKRASGCPKPTCGPGRYTTTKRDSIEAYLTIVMAALAVSRWLERQIGWSIKKFVTTLRRYRSIAIQTGDHILHAGTPLDDDVRAAISTVNNAAAGH